MHACMQVCMYLYIHVCMGRETCCVFALESTLDIMLTVSSLRWGRSTDGVMLTNRSNIVDANCNSCMYACMYV